MTLYKKQFKAMGCVNEIQIQDSRLKASQIEILINQSIEKVKQTEQKYSRYLESSILSQINQSAGKYEIQVDHETATLLNYAETCYQQSDGLFDITSGILRKIWNFDQKIIPNQKDIDNTLNYIGWNKIQWDGKNLFLPLEKMELDFGGIVKEFTADQISYFLTTQNVQYNLVNLGGDIKISYHSKMKPKLWNIGIKNPRIHDQILGNLEINNGAMTTSGDYERFFMHNNQRFCHIFNPKTGYPIEDGKHLQSVTIIADFCVVAGSLSTFAMLLPESEALDFLKDLNLKFVAINSKSQIIYN